MKSAAFVLAAALTATPAYAQLGGLLKKADKAKAAADKVQDLHINDQEERQLGEQVSKNLTEKYGVYQNADVTKYVSLVGTVLAQSSTRPNLDWKFIVLDTDGVNAFAAPGGIVHVTRGLLGLIKNEAELAGVLGHEITHVTKKHTVRYIEQQKTISAGTEAVGSGGNTRQLLIAKMSERAYHILLDGEYSRDDEREADKIGVELASKIGYAPLGLAEALKKVDARNAGRAEKNGLFASHPAITERIDAIEAEVKNEKLPGTATVAARYAKNITFDAKPVTEIAMTTDGAAGLAGGSTSAAAPKEEPKKKGGLLSKFSTSSSEQKQSSQTIASAGSRGGLPDRDAKGGPNKTPLVIKLTPGEIAAFRAGING